jgi:hypothetical protein
VCTGVSARRRGVTAGALGAGILLLAPLAGAQLTYSRGQTVAPAYEGWERDEDGKRYFLFGYMNRNWLEEVDVPVGPDNRIEPGPADQGQPTHFLPRRNRFVFRVPVPAGFGEADEMVWTLTTRGKTERAHATLALDYFVDDLVKASERGALGAGTSDPVIRANRAPTLELEGPARRTVQVGEPLELVALASDDGIPKVKRRQGEAAFFLESRAEPGKSIDPAFVPPRQVTVDSATGLWVTCYPYRAAGPVELEPEQIKVWEDSRTGANSPWAPLWKAPEPPADGRWEITATFGAPGEYMLRCLANDGALATARDVTVLVSAP